MSQSDERARRRPGSAFGAPAPVEEVVPGGQAFHVVVHAEVVPDEASLAVLHQAIRDVTRAAVLDGYAAAFADIEAAEKQPGGGDGGTPPGPDPGGGS